MSNDPNAGGDISSGFGESQVAGEVSDEKAEKMLHGGPPADEENQDSPADSGDNEPTGS